MLELLNFRTINSPKSLKKIAHERDKIQHVLRTSHPTTKKNQMKWYSQIIGDDTCQYFYIINKDKKLVGYCGLDKIHPINRNAEISLLIFEKYKGQNYGAGAVGQLLDYGFNVLNLNSIFGECYTTTTNITFWKKCGFNHDGRLRCTKYWKGTDYDSEFFSMTKNEWVINHETD